MINQEVQVFQFIDFINDQTQIMPFSVEELIQKVKEEKSPVLDLGNMGLHEVPKAVFDLEHLEILILGKWYFDQEKKRWFTSQNERTPNSIRELPADIIALKQLKAIYINHNNLESIPNLAPLEELKVVDFKHNELADISGLADLPALKRLYLGENRIQNLDALTGLSQIDRLDLMNNDINDITPLKFLKRLEKIDLSNNIRIKDFSPITDLKNLRVFASSSNDIQDISFLTAFEKLEWLYLTNNHIKDITPIKESILLERLDLRFNQVENISPLADFGRLEALGLRNNQIRDIEPLQHLVSLRTLGLFGNYIKDFSPLAKLPKLASLDIGKNKIEALDFIEKLENLRILILKENEISNISSLQGLRKLGALDLSNNRVKDVSPLEKLDRLHTVNLRNNRILNIRPLINLIEQGLSLKWSSIGGGRGILIGGNPLASPPPEIVKRGNEEVIRYFEELDLQGTFSLYEAKLLIVGEPGAGKTTLARKLQDPNAPMPEEEETTNGIDINSMKFQLEEHNKFHMNIWDFGGQEIYHATHQFFLTKRSLYILVSDDRRENTDFNYWLQVVEVLGGDSPVIVLQNEKAGRYRQVDINQLRGRFSNIQGHYLANLKTNHNLEAVREAVRFFIQQLPHIGQELPRQWVYIREELEQLATKHEPYISDERYLKICQDFGVTDKIRALDLSQYYHDLGVFLHFQNHPLLKRTIILQNEWATEAVYKALYNGKVMKNHGQFTEDLAREFWSDKQYEGMHDELLALMMMFELCYQLPDVVPRTFLIPQLLSMSPPQNYQWDNNQRSLMLKYQYKFMPKGLLNRFMVRNHFHIPINPILWKSGVVLKWQNSQAEILKIYDEEAIQIRIAGPETREFMAVISEDFDRLHAQFEKIQVEKLIPCNCEECKNSTSPSFFTFQTIQNARLRKIAALQCNRSFQHIQITELLEGVFSEDKLQFLQERNKQLVSIVNNHIIENDMEAAFNILQENIQDRRMHNQLTLILARYNEITQRYHTNLLNDQQYFTEKQKITVAILELIGNLLD